jgi:hypothetical protein
LLSLAASCDSVPEELFCVGDLLWDLLPLVATACSRRGGA